MELCFDQLIGLCVLCTFDLINTQNKREATFTGPLQVWPMVYILYIGINLASIIKQYGDRKNSSGF